MAWNDLYSSTLAVLALPSGAHVNGAINGTTVDLSVFRNDFRTALFVVSVGTITDGTHALKLQDSPDGTTWTDVDAAHTLGGPVSSLASNTVAALGYKSGEQEFVRLVATVSGATTGGVYGAVAVLGEGSIDPANRS
jgi:hypothetical protein